MVSLLTIMAHADDAELWAGGVIARTTSQGSTAVIALPLSDDVRNREAADGAAALGATLRLLPALGTVTPRDLQDLVTDLQPTAVITHPATDIHPDHRHIASLLSQALPDVVISTGHPQRVYASDGYWNLSQDGQPLHLPTIIDITDVWDTKMRALAAHGSQPIIEHFGPMTETLSRLHGGRIGTQHAEAFAAVPILGRVPPSIL